MSEYCITWGETEIKSIVFANSEDEAIAKLKTDLMCTGNENFKPNVKRVAVIR